MTYRTPAASRADQSLSKIQACDLQAAEQPEREIMTAIYIDQKLDDDSRRDRLYKGRGIFVYSANEHSMALIELARKLIAEAFSRASYPRTAQYKYDVREFGTQSISKLKPAFIHHPECKQDHPADAGGDQPTTSTRSTSTSRACARRPATTT